MQRSVGRLAAVLLTAAAAWSMASAAQAVRAWEGQDYAEVLSPNTSVSACDGEVDGNGVWSDYYRGNNSNYNTVTNYQGSGTCESSGTGTAIRSFRIVEDGIFNSYSGWVSP